MLIKVDMKRFQDELDKLFAYPVETGKVVLYGSSFFGVWGHDRAAAQMDGKVVNNGFGGATGEELLFYYHDLVRPFKPSAIVLRPGLNDVLNGYTAKQAAQFAIRVAEWARTDFPEIPVGFLPSFCCPFLFNLPKELFKSLNEFNDRIIDYCAQNRDMVFLDINPFFYEAGHSVGESDGFKDIFEPDGLHLIDKGYEEFSPYFMKMLTEKGFLR